ncbi:CoA-binding protein [Actinocatenispora thailandica]|uniref:CoA-binding protein n=1 Tax=Actinocatenispora thailandica TaxID=227318 RepID=UPI001951C2D1
MARVLDLRTWAVVGLTDNPARTAYRIAQVLLDRGKHVIAVNPRGEPVLGCPGVRTLAEIDEQIDVVDVFRRSEQAGAHVDEAIAAGATAVWLQLGVVDEAAADRAAAAGLAVVMDTCPAIEWSRSGQ